MIRRSCDTCGHSRTYSSPAMADAFFPRHSCATNLERQARHARRLARAQASGEVRDCEHRGSPHRHGTRQAYAADRCRCRACRDANAARGATNRRRVAYGLTGRTFVDAAPASVHVQHLVDAGMGLKTIRQVSGVAYSTLQALLPARGGSQRRQRTRVRRDVEQRILAVSLKPAPSARVDGTGTRRRLRALVAIGWSIAAVGRSVGLTSSNAYSLICAADGTTVFQRTADRVAAVYDELWDQPQHGTDRFSRNSATRARNIAAANGWLPPMAYDDDTIDDPAVAGDVGARVRKNAALDADEVRWLHDLGESVLAIADRFDVSCDYVEQRLRLTAGGAAA